MPSTDTITSTDFTTFSANTRIRSSPMNANFSVFRGHNLPVDPNTSAAADLTYDLGSYTYSWRRAHAQELVLNDLAATPSNPTAGFYKLYAKSDGKAYLLDNTGAETQVGSGSGGINYISQNDGSAVTLWNTYADATSTVIDATGGSATLNWTSSSSNPMRSSTSFVWTPGTKGDGVKFDFSLSSADLAQVMQISGDYEIGTYTSYTTGAAALYIYDITSQRVIQPSGYQIQKIAGKGRLNAQFQTDSTSTAYRLAIHQTTTDVGYTIKFDNLSVGPQVVQYGAPITDWVKYTPATTTGFGTIASDKIFWRRVGDSIQVQGYFQVGTATGSTAALSLPAGLSVASDTSRISSSTHIVGEWWRGNGSATTVKRGAIIAYSTIGNVVNFTRDDYTTAANPFAAAAGTTIVANSDDVTLIFTVPVQGWSSSVQMSNDTDTRVVAFLAHRNGSDQTSINPNNSYVKMTLNSVVTSSGLGGDSHGAFDTATNNRYIVQVPGWYKFDGKITIQGTNVLANIYRAAIYKNGSSVYEGSSFTPGAGSAFNLFVNPPPIQAVAGDYFELYFFGAGNNSASTLSSFGTVGLTNFGGMRLSGPSAIAASETVAARYTSNAGANVVTDTIINFEDKDYDSHGAVTIGASWKFTAPISGTYRINARLTTDAATAGAITNTVGMRISKNAGAASTYVAHELAKTTSSIRKMPHGSTTVKLLAGETVSLLGVNGTGSTHAMEASGDGNYIEIDRVGNY